MSLVTDLRPVLNDVLPIIDELGLLEFDVTMQVKTWPARQGVGTPTTTTETALTLNDDGVRVGVELVSTRDVIASGGRYREGDYKIGPFVPAYDGGGRDPSFFDPQVSGPAEILFHIEGPGADVWCKKVETDCSDPFQYFVILRATGVRNP